MGRNRNWLVAFLALLVGAALSGFFWWQLVSQPVEKTSPGPAEIFIIQRGEGIGQIARRLKKEDLIRSPFAFKLLVLTKDLSQKIQAGDFRLRQNMDLDEVVNQLTHGTLDVWVTLLEGWRSEEMAQKL